ncbi:MAG: radical SAM family heme chaperone HemW [Gammaproteobacteria bacterium]
MTMTTNPIAAQPINTTIAPPPLTLYLHLPWCIRKCPYCDFNSHRAAKTLPEEEYVAAMLADAESAVPQVWGRRIVAAYLGGGTPNLFSPAALDKLLCGLRALFNIAPDAEITMEANPGAACEAKFAEYRALGISRLSLGAQSFNNTLLNSIGRVHCGKQSQQAAKAAARTFGNFNMDLMHALPGQDVKSALDDVHTALTFDPAHLSLYQLTLETGTPFYRRPPPRLPNDDETAVVGDAVANFAIGRGFLRYEISAFSRPKKECAHNLNYWRFGDYLGIGAGAHGKLTIGGKIIRQMRVKNPNDYMRRAQAGNAIAEQKQVSGREAVFEFLLNALRLTDGFAVNDLAARTAMTTAAIETELQKAERDKLIMRTITRIKPSPLGLRFLNDLLMRFLPT